MSDEDTSVKNSLKWAKLNRNLFRDFLQERYGKKIAEKMINFIEVTFAPLNRMDFNSFVRLFRDFVKGGVTIHAKFCFNVFKGTHTNCVCEHDLYSMFESFK